MPKKGKSAISAGDNSIVIGGDVKDSNIVVGNNNKVSNQVARIAPLFETIYRTVEASPSLSSPQKADVKAELEDIQTALEEPQPNEGFLLRRFRNIQRMAPEIVEVAFETLKNPIGGVAEVVKRVAKKMAEEASAS
ncbi:MAG: hypothetical protein LDL51_06285 [Chloroflexi bacterium]|nr:hypothetical protein [Chloroflexota bacterium]